MVNLEVPHVVVKGTQPQIPSMTEIDPSLRSHQHEVVVKGFGAVDDAHVGPNQEIRALVEPSVKFLNVNMIPIAKIGTRAGPGTVLRRKATLRHWICTEKMSVSIWRMCPISKVLSMMQERSLDFRASEGMSVSEF